MSKNTKKKTRICNFLCIFLVFITCDFFILFFVDVGFKRFSKLVFYHTWGVLAKNIASKPDVKLDMAFHRQEHSLSCEIAALTMILNYYGVPVTESQLLKNLPFNTLEPRSKDNIWGDPNVGFVGNIDGKSPNEGYGVYENPIADLAQKYRSASVLTPATLEQVLFEVLSGHPVIVWGTLASGKDISWRTKDGKFIEAIYGEHARVIIGYAGTPQDPKKIFLLDPIYGEISMSKQKFISNWELLGNKAVVVY